MSQQEMRCPKCRGSMFSYERSGVVIEQCEDCRGIFLDRGELERLTEAEAAYYRAQVDQQPPAATPPPAAGAAPGSSSGVEAADLMKAVVKMASSSSGKKGSKSFLGQLLR